MRKSQIALGERWKWHFQASRFQNFLGEHAPRLPERLAPPARDNFRFPFFYEK